MTAQGERYADAKDGWLIPDTLPQDGRCFVAMVFYEPQTYPDPHPGMETLRVTPKPTPVVLGDWRRHDRLYRVMPFGIPLGGEWRIAGWMPLEEWLV